MGIGLNYMEEAESTGERWKEIRRIEKKVSNSVNT